MRIATLLTSSVAVCGIWTAQADAKQLTLNMTSPYADMGQAFAAPDGSGVVLLHNHTDGVLSDDAANPLVGAKGDCFGSLRLSAGLMSGDGYCGYTDAGGEMIFVHWIMDPAASPHGAWQFSGGTGKWSTAVGGGIWSDPLVPGQKTGTTTISGTVEFK